LTVPASFTICSMPPIVIVNGSSIRRRMAEPSGYTLGTLLSRLTRSFINK
jgi:hypothetical protein